ncbi:MAG: hypothetical protein MZV63_67565 [Marinilabiliales bacterium]|nr:hypothetical protein [Marinilabiliales bacterium]
MIRCLFLSVSSYNKIDEYLRENGQRIGISPDDSRGMDRGPVPGYKGGV